MFKHVAYGKVRKFLIYHLTVNYMSLHQLFTSKQWIEYRLTLFKFLCYFKKQILVFSNSMRKLSYLIRENILNKYL